MPTVLQLQGWRCYFNSNEGHEAVHVYAQKGQSEAKYWLHPEQFVIEEDFEHNLTPRSRRDIRRIVYMHMDELMAAWTENFGGRRGY